MHLKCKACEKTKTPLPNFQTAITIPIVQSVDGVPVSLETCLEKLYQKETQTDATCSLCSKEGVERVITKEFVPFDVLGLHFTRLYQ